MSTAWAAAALRQNAPLAQAVKFRCKLYDADEISRKVLNRLTKFAFPCS
jgi:hypothetical protein